MIYSLQHEWPIDELRQKHLTRMFSLVNISDSHLMSHYLILHDFLDNLVCLNKM